MKKLLYLLALMICAFIMPSRAGAQTTIVTHTIMPGCDSEGYLITTSSLGTITTDTIRVYFGDGSSTTMSADSGMIYLYHQFASSGVYTVKYILYHGTSAVDSLFDYDTVNLCHTISLITYLDNNSNCINDGGDSPVMLPYQVEIDSAGVPVDTITATSIYYPAYGPSGTIYTLRLLAPPSGTDASCPTSGVVYDTIGTGSQHKEIGLTCSSSSSFDLAESVTIGGPGRHTFTAHINVTNGSCTAHSATLTYTFCPRYNFSSASLTPSSVSGNVITWNLTGVSFVSPQFITVYFDAPATAWLTAGDTIHNKWVLTPITGDIDTTNNTVDRIDTVKMSYDPNQKSVTPQGIVSAGTKLNYQIEFENTGNAPAANIHVQDTLSSNVDVNTFELVSTTAQVYTSFAKDAAGRNVVKFDFQGINLLDSSHHSQCTGMVTFNINTKHGLAIGTRVDNRAGIYFDDNDVVMTNTVENIIGIPTSVAVLSNSSKVDIYPNPATLQLTINCPDHAYNTFVIANMMGQTMTNGLLVKGRSVVDVAALPAGIYTITLKGDSGVKTQKFEKQ